MMYPTVYLDNAASTFPKPRAVRRAVQHQLARNTSNPGRSGHFLSRLAAEDLYESREEIAAFFGCEAENVIFTQNATHALNLLLCGILRPGDHAVISDMEHNAVLRPLVRLAETAGITFDIADTDGGRCDRPEERFACKIRRNTRLLVCTHASNVTGRIFDPVPLAGLAHENGALFCLDASQTAGFLPISMKRDGIDAVCTSGHKGLLGIQGSGLLLLRRDFGVLPLTVGGNGVQSLEEHQEGPLPERLEAGTLSSPAIVSMAEGIRFLKRHPERLRREESLHRDLFSRLQSLPFVTLYSGMELHVPTVAFSLAGIPSEEVTERLSDSGICVRGGWHCSRLAHRALHTEEEGLVRASLSPLSGAHDAERIAEELENLYKNKIF